MANVQENISRFMMAKDKARKLIQMDSNGQLDNITENAKRNGKIDYNGDGTIDMSPMMEHNVQRDVNTYAMSAPQISSHSKMPKEILESMTSNRIDTSALAVPGVGGSILDQLNSITNGQVLQESKPQKRVVTETVQYNQQPQTSNANVDYSMIKMIVEECMRKYTSSLKKSIINESKNTNVNEVSAVKLGNKFSFITKDGNLYEATLKFVKNINDK